MLWESNMIRTFVINLKESKDRWMSIKKQLDDLWIEYDRFEAINPKLMTREEVDKIYDRELASKLFPPGWLTLGSLWCSYSHLSIYKKIVEEKIPLSLVLEDDVIVSKKVKELYDALRCKNLDLDKEKWDYLSMNYWYFWWNYLRTFFKKVSENYFRKWKVRLSLLYFLWGILYTLMDFFPRIISKIRGKTLIIKRYRPFYLTWWYFITYEWAKKLLSINPKVFCVADWLPEKYRKKSELKFYVTVPVLCVQDVWTFESTNKWSWIWFY